MNLLTCNYSKIMSKEAHVWTDNECLLKLNLIIKSTWNAYKIGRVLLDELRVLGELDWETSSFVILVWEIGCFELSFSISA